MDSRQFLREQLEFTRKHLTELAKEIDRKQRGFVELEIANIIGTLSVDDKVIAKVLADIPLEGNLTADDEPQGKAHQFYKCPETCEGCQYCDGGLAYCTICKKGEVELAPTCPGSPDEPQPDHIPDITEMVQQQRKGYQVSDYWRENCLTCGHLRCDHDDGEGQYCNLLDCDCPKFVEGEISGKHTPSDEDACSFCGKGRWDGIHHDGCDECHPFSTPSDEAEG